MKKSIFGAAIAGAMVLLASTASAVQLELKYQGNLPSPTDAQKRDMPVGGFGPVDHGVINTFLNAGGGTNFDVGAKPGTTSIDALVYKGDKAAGSGLWVTDLDGIASIDVRFTYMGSEAGFKNFSVGGDSSSGQVVFDNKSGIAGGTSSTVSFDVSGVSELWLPFLFETVYYNHGAPLGSGTKAINNGTIASTLQMGFLMQENGDLFTNSLGIENGSTIALFGDGTGDSDLDDLIVGIGVVGVTAVPVPAALPLLLTGIAGLGLLGRRKRNQA